MNYPNKICRPFISLPTVFTDMLSWYDTLNKLYGYLQQQEKVIEDIQEQIDGGGSGGGGGGGTIPEGLEEDINNLKQAVAQLQETMAQITQLIAVQQETIQSLSSEVYNLDIRLTALENRQDNIYGAELIEYDNFTETVNVQNNEILTGTFSPVNL